MKLFILLLISIIFSVNLIANDVLPPNQKKGRSAAVFSQKVLVRLKPGYDIFDKDAILIKKSELKADYLLHPKSSITYNSKLLKSLEPSLQASKIFNAEEKLLRTFIVYYDGTLEPEDYCRQLILSNPAVEIAEPYYVPEFMSFLPNDPQIPNQDANLQLIKAYEAWEIEKGNPEVIIGISDSGANQDHEDLEDNLAINNGEIPDDGIDNDNNGYIDDYSGYDFSWESTGSGFPGDTYNASDNHGQQVAGIAGASTNNSIGIAGIGFKSKLFPLKIIEGNSLKYAYESIVYAGLRGFKVLNCSWGNVKPFSDIDQSIINYAISRDVAIVAAAGNTSSKATKYDLFYPSGYYGVLGVGEVNSNDRLINSSSISAGCRILAPGEGNFTTTNNSYSQCDGGTSFSAPVVAGAVALARSRFPQLNALQAIEFVRQAVDVHNQFSISDRELIPGRINLLKAVTMNPFSIPAILPHKYSYFDSEGTETDRFKAGDKVSLKIAAKNVLGSASNLNFILSIAFDPTSSVTITDSTYSIDFVAAGQEIELSNFALMVTQNFSGNVILRVDVIGENGYRDFFKFEFVPSRVISTFANNEIKFSMSDIGEFGFSTNTATDSGIGFAYRDYGNQVYRNSSIMLAAPPNKIVFNAKVGKIYGFSTIKGFVPPNRNIGIFDDSKGGNYEIGVEITQEIEFPTPESKATRMKFKLKNTSGEVIEDAAFGIFIDWDIGNDTEKNRTKLLTDAKPSEFPENSSAAQAVYATEGYPYFGSAVYSDFPEVEAQAAGLDFTVIGSFDGPNRYSSLNSGKTLQSQIESDMGAVTGIKFLGSWEPDAIRECVICVGAGDDEADLNNSLKNCLLNSTSVNDNITNNLQISIYPNPAIDFIYLESLSSIEDLEYSILNVVGSVASNVQNYSGLNEGERLGIDVSHLPTGFYILKLVINGIPHFEKIVISR